MNPRTISVLIGCALICGLHVPVHAAGADSRDAPLAVRPDLSKVVTKKRRRTPRPLDNGCAVAALGQRPGALPYGPGERLEYDIAMFGLPTGTIKLSVDPARGRGENVTLPVRAEGSTMPLVAFMGGIEAKMVTHLDPETQLPQKMASRVHVKRPFKDEVMIREDALFVPHDVQSHLTYRVGEKDREWDARRNGSTDVVDVLSVLYYARSRDFQEGTPFCFEVFHRRWLWRVSGTIGGTTLVDVPFGEQKARRIDAVVRRVRKAKKAKPNQKVKTPAPKRPPEKDRTLVIWVSDDAQRLPLLLSTENDSVGEVQLRLVSHRRGVPLPAKPRTAFSRTR